MVNIKEFAQLCRTTVKTIRFYDNTGLLKADYIAEDSGYRYYRRSAVSKYYKIAALKEAGFSLEEIRRQLYHLSMEQVLEVLDRRLDILEKQAEACRALRKGVVERMEDQAKYQVEAFGETGEIRVGTSEVELRFTLAPSVREHLDACAETLREICLSQERFMIGADFQDLLTYFDKKQLLAWQTRYFKPRELNEPLAFALDAGFRECSHLFMLLRCGADASLAQVQDVVEAVTHGGTLDPDAEIFFALMEESEDSETGLYAVLMGLR